MEKYFFSSRKLFHTILATVTLILIYARSLYSRDLRPVLILQETELTTLNNVVSELKQQPAAMSVPIFNKYVCHDNYVGIDCNCNSTPYPPEYKCDYDRIGRQRCRNYITCHVRSITLRGQHLSGKISSSIQDLTYLEALDLNTNQLRGPIPKELSRLNKLKTLILYKNYLDGSIPKELCTMQSLQNLDLGVNLLSGEIPEELGNITTLRYLTLTSNRFEGKLPKQLGYLKWLRTLALADNAFNGTLPDEFKNLEEMHYFDVMGNNFSGPLPRYTWPKLLQLNLLGNNFEGPIPNQISSSTDLVTLMISDLIDNEQGFPFPNISILKSLETLIFRNCSIRGEIHESIGNLSSLKNIDLSFNGLSGELPMIMSNLSLDSLYLTKNKFIGPIPTWVEDVKNADFSHNSFSEVKFKYSEEMSSHLNLYACCDSKEGKFGIEWENNTFSCPAKTKPTNTQLFINCGGFKTLNNDKNNYEADMSPNGASTFYMSETWAYNSAGIFLGPGGNATDDSHSDYLQTTSCLDSDTNAVPLSTTARISPVSLKYYGFCLEEDHYTVKLYFNEIVFTNATDYGINAKRVFDVFIQGAPVLKDFDIKKAALGPRKEIVENFTAYVEKNKALEIHFYWAGKGSLYIPHGLYGPLVSAISVTPVQRPPKKLLLKTGQIVGIAGSSAFAMVLILAFFHKMGWSGKILMSKSGRRCSICRRLRRLMANVLCEKGTLEELTDPGLENDDEIESLPRVRSKMSEVASIPEGETEVVSIPEGEAKVASIPEGEASIPEGETEVVSIPEGEAKVASIPEGETEVVSIPEGEAKVASIPEGEASIPEGETEGEASITEGEASIPEGKTFTNVPEGEASIPEGEAAPNYSNKASTFRDGTSDPFSSSDLMAHGETYNLQQLKDATRNFDPDNQIGRGSHGRVYKGELPSGLVIAVKQPVSNSKEGKQAFINEVAIVTGLDHPNLVKLLGCCFEDNQLLLVYEYMENNSLYTALFGDRNSNLKSRLNWQARLKICLGIAKGLAYLHEESKPKIIHRNIKPTNILLDKDLNAKLSGFGLAKHHEEKHTLGTKVGGTSCYTAPEYATRGLLTSKSDVYNFGVVMLEIVSGKVSTDYILDRASVLEEHGKLLDLMDPDLKKDFKVISQAERVLNLAMLCTKKIPAVRPMMSEVVSILEGKKTVPKVVPSKSF